MLVESMTTDCGLNQRLSNLAGIRMSCPGICIFKRTFPDNSAGQLERHLGSPGLANINIEQANHKQYRNGE